MVIRSYAVLRQMLEDERGFYLFSLICRCCHFLNDFFRLAEPYTGNLAFSLDHQVEDRIERIFALNTSNLVDGLSLNLGPYLHAHDKNIRPIADTATVIPIDAVRLIILAEPVTLHRVA